MREDLAELIACYVSGYSDAIAEEEDFEMADKLIELIDEEYSK